MQSQGLKGEGIRAIGLQVCPATAVVLRILHPTVCCS